MSTFHSNLKLLAVATSLCFASAAQADSGLDISGRIALGMDHVDHVDNSANGGSTSARETHVSGNNWGTSLLTINGFYDLPSSDTFGNTKAILMLESGFDANRAELNGDGTVFNRRAYVGLQSDRAGTLIAGRDLSLSINTWYIDPFYQQFMSTPTLVRSRNWLDVHNMVAYTSPTWNGWAAAVQFGLGEPHFDFHAGRKDAAQISYTSDKLRFYTIYDQRRDVQGRFSSLFSNSQELTTGAAWHLDTWDLFAGYEHLSAPDATPVEAGGDGYRRADHTWAGAQWWTTPRWRLQAAAYHIDVSDGGGQATLAVVGTTYNITKDLFLYASYGRVMNGHTADFAVEASDQRPMAGSNQDGVYFGFIYSFKHAWGGH